MVGIEHQNSRVLGWYTKHSGVAVSMQAYVQKVPGLIATITTSIRI
jgi:hypothetical protein